MNKNRNCAIDILRFIFAILIVAYHTSPFVEFSKIGSYFFSQTVSRLAVPFFSTTAGYFFFKKEKKDYLALLKKYIYIYAFWSVLMLVYDAIHWNGSVQAFSLHALKTFFFTGWHHLWYLLAIIYTIVILSVSNAISKKSNSVFFCASFVLLAVGISISNYGAILLELPILNVFKTHNRNMIVGWLFIVVPFFMLGYALNKNSSVPSGIYHRNPLVLVFISLFGLLAEILFTTLLHLHVNVALCIFTYPTVLFLFVWALKCPCPHLSAIAHYCESMASVIYFCHYIIAIETQSKNCTETISFLLCVILPAIIGFIIAKIDNPIINRIL